MLAANSGTGASKYHPSTPIRAGRPEHIVHLDRIGLVAPRGPLLTEQVPECFIIRNATNHSFNDTRQGQRHLRASCRRSRLFNKKGRYLNDLSSIFEKTRRFWIIAASPAAGQAGFIYAYDKKE